MCASPFVGMRGVCDRFFKTDRARGATLVLSFKKKKFDNLPQSEHNVETCRWYATS
jgi:hypothetical protein